MLEDGGGNTAIPASQSWFSVNHPVYLCHGGTTSEITLTKFNVKCCEKSEKINLIDLIESVIFLLFIVALILPESFSGVSSFL